MGERDYLVEQLTDCPEYYWTKLSPFPTSVRALGALMLAAQRRMESGPSYRIGEIPVGKAPRWLSTVRLIDQTCGGFYGLTTLGGAPGLGKSLLARASLVEAAATLDWNVIVFDAENAPEELEGKYASYLEAHPHAEDAVPNMRLVSVTRGMDIYDFIGHVDAVAGDDRPILVGLDSINTIAELMDGDYLRCLRDLSLWAMMARRMGRGSVCFLVVSELNRSGGAKGEKLNYWSDLFVSMTGERKAGYVRLKIRKTRDSAGEGDERKLVRVYHQARFLEESQLYGQQPRFSVVGGTDAAADTDDEGEIL